MDSAIRVGAVNYLNTKPLICDLEQLAPEVELVLDVPSRLADRLAAGELDVALIPVIEYFRAGVYSIVPDIAIATRGPVLSVTLFSREPWPRIRRVALDAGSRTSAALTQILLRKRYGVNPEVVATAAGPHRRGNGRRRRPADWRPGHARLPAGLCLRVRPGAGVVRLDRLAVRLRGLGGARQGWIWGEWRPCWPRRSGAAWRGRAPSPIGKRRGWGSTRAFAVAT